MPKEIIYGNRNTQNLVAVQWVKDGQVQVGIKFDPKQDDEIAYAKFFDYKGNEIGAVEEGIGYDSVWVDFLDRGQINDLIVVLRRARDNALGKDA